MTQSSALAEPQLKTSNSRFDEAEWKARLELAACYRIFAMYGWNELIYNHITLRLPAKEGAGPEFLINPFGLHYTEITASNLVKVDIDGRVVDGSQGRVNPAGFVIHSAIHGGLPDAHCVMHTHTTAGVAVASLAGGLNQSNFYSAHLHDKLAYHDFEGLTLYPDEKPRLLKSIGDKPAVILRNHGLLAWGSTVPVAFSILFILQRACEVQLATMSMGNPLPISERIAARCTADALQFKPQAAGSAGEVFDALIRQIDRIDPGYKL